MRRGLILLAMLVGCEAPRPDFVLRIQQDCQDGDVQACAMIATSATAPQPQPQPLPAAVRPLTLVQRDVDAILRGIERTRASPRMRLPSSGGS